LKKEEFMQKIAGCKLPEKEALRRVCEKMMDAGLNRNDAAVIIKNFKGQRTGI